MSTGEETDGGSGVSKDEEWEGGCVVDCCVEVSGVVLEGMTTGGRGVSKGDDENDGEKGSTVDCCCCCCCCCVRGGLSRRWDEERAFSDEAI